MAIKGEEGGVNTITRACFDLDIDVGRKHRYSRGVQQSYSAIGVVCLFLVTVEFILQLLLIPQGSLFGWPITFIVSLTASWTYDYNFSSAADTENIQADLLFQIFGRPQIYWFCVLMRTMIAVLVCLLLFDDVNDSSVQERLDRRFGIIQALLFTLLGDARAAFEWIRFLNHLIPVMVHNKKVLGV